VRRGLASIEWDSIPREKLEENIELMRNGAPVNLSELYVLPKRAKLVHQNFVDRLERGKWGFLLVMGDNRSGKSAYLKYVQGLAQNRDYCVVFIELNEERIKQVGTGHYFSEVFFNNLRLPNGQLFSHSFFSDEAFREKVVKTLKDRQADFEFFSYPLTTALISAADSSTQGNSGVAKAWLRGESQYVADLRSLDIFDKSARSLLDVPVASILYFERELVTSLGYRGILVLVDEIERAGNLPSAKGRETLFVLRNLINALVSEESQAGKRGILQGIFLCFAISTFYLGFSHVIEVNPIEFKARADREGRPKVLITDVPRLGMLLRHSATLLDTEVEEEDLREIASRIIGCYSRAYNTEIPITARDLESRAYNITGGPLAGPNVQQMVKILDDLTKQG